LQRNPQNTFVSSPVQKLQLHRGIGGDNDDDDDDSFIQYTA